MAMGLVAYNPNDPEQRSLLAALRQGESGGNYTIGWGGTDLAGKPVDAYGFPQWSGKPGPAGVSHAAGAYQFQPGTWRNIASKYGLNFQSKTDQDTGAWYNAQERYARETGGSLDADLDAGLFTKVQNALRQEWTSVTGSASLPGGLAVALSQGVGREIAPGPTDYGSTGTPSLLTSPMEAISTYFVRGGMILVGALILGVALWALLKSDVMTKGVSV